MTTPTIDLDAVRLASGRHSSPDDGMCVMDLASYLAHEPFSDHPKCASPVIAFAVVTEDGQTHGVFVRREDAEWIAKDTRWTIVPLHSSPDWQRINREWEDGYAAACANDEATRKATLDLMASRRPSAPPPEDDACSHRHVDDGWWCELPIGHDGNHAAFTWPDATERVEWPNGAAPSVPEGGEPAPAEQEIDNLLTAFQEACERVVTSGDSYLGRTTKERAILRNDIRGRLLRSSAPSGSGAPLTVAEIGRFLREGPAGSGTATPSNVCAHCGERRTAHKGGPDAWCPLPIGPTTRGREFSQSTRFTPGTATPEATPAAVVEIIDRFAEDHDELMDSQLVSADYATSRAALVAALRSGARPPAEASEWANMKAAIFYALGAVPHGEFTHHWLCKLDEVFPALVRAYVAGVRPPEPTPAPDKSFWDMTLTEMREELQRDPYHYSRYFQSLAPSMRSGSRVPAPTAPPRSDERLLTRYQLLHAFVLHRGASYDEFQTAQKAILGHIAALELRASSPASADAPETSPWISRRLCNRCTSRPGSLAIRTDLPPDRCAACGELLGDAPTPEER